MTFEPPAAAQAYCSLAQLKKGEYATVMGLARPDSAHPACFCSRMTAMGFFRGEKVCVVTGAQDTQDSVIVRLGNATFALGASEAAMIYVMREAPCIKADAFSRHFAACLP